MAEELKKYFMVIAKCGHVGRQNYIPIKFAVVAESRKEAAQVVRCFGRVKHDHKDAILDVKEIDYIEYCEIKKSNDEDPYLRCHSKYEQKQIANLEERFVTDNHSSKKIYDKQERIDRIAYKSKKQKIIKKCKWEQTYEYAY